MDSENINVPVKERIKEKIVSEPEHIQQSFKTHSIISVLLKIISFAFISSDIFKDNVLCLFSNTISGGDILLFGMLIQSILLILIWAGLEKFF
jgi:hypothetical protein